MAFDKIIKNDLSKIAGMNNTFFTGVDDLSREHILDPYVSGFAYCRIVGLPSWFEKDEDLKHFKDLFHRNFRSFNGVSNMTVNFAQHQTGFANHNYDVVSGISRGNEEFTVGHKEYSGGVMRKMYQKWVTYVRDPRTGIALYPNAFDVEYSSANHTAEILYMVVRPDAINSKSDNVIEYAAYYSNVFPREIVLDQYNYTQGENNSNTFDQQFSGFVEIGPDVDAYALDVLRNEVIGGDNKLNFVDSFGFNTEGVKGAFGEDSTNGLGKIFNKSSEEA